MPIRVAGPMLFGRRSEGNTKAPVKRRMNGLKSGDHYRPSVFAKALRSAIGISHALVLDLVQLIIIEVGVTDYYLGRCNRRGVTAKLLSLVTSRKCALGTALDLRKTFRYRSVRREAWFNVQMRPRRVQFSVVFPTYDKSKPHRTLIGNVKSPLESKPGAS